MNRNLDRWCEDAVQLICYGPDRDAVYRELRDHLEDAYDAATHRGLTPEEATQEVLKQMGPARELAPQLAAVHKPFWGYVLTACRCVLWIVLLGVLAQGAWFLYDNRPSQSADRWFYENPGEELVQVWEDGAGEYRRVLDLTPEVSASCDGFTFDLSRAVMLFRDHYTDDTQDHHSFWFRIEVSDLFQWDLMDDLPRDDFWAVDSLGNVYVPYRKAAYDTQSFVNGNLERTGLFTYRMDMWLTNFQSQDAQWIELRYERDGRDLRLRIDLTGGDEQ